MSSGERVVMSPRTPRSLGFRQPAEWAPHRACWLAWPSDPNLWPHGLEAAQTCIQSLARGIARPGRMNLGEMVEVLVQSPAAMREAEGALCGLRARFHLARFGDIWLRDTGPLFLEHEDGTLAAARFRFNGWGGKFNYPHDTEVGQTIAEAAEVPRFDSAWVMEGGAIETDGAGCLLATRQSLLGGNRNPGRGEQELSDELCGMLGADRIVWLPRGLLHDHTDGHVDNVARFVRPGVVLCARAADATDPQAEVLAEVEQTLRDAGLEVRTLPSPGRIDGPDGEPLPASYLNFYIANRSVVVPTYGQPQDKDALAVLQGLFPSRSIVGVPSLALLQEGGALHCVTQPQPAGLGVR